MKIKISYFLLLILIIGCKQEIVTEQEVDIQATAETNTIPASDKISNLVIKNEKDYSPEFLEGLRQLPLENVTLDGNLFIENTDTISFPFFPVMNKYTVLTAKKDNLAIALKLKRINQTTIDYEIEMVETGKAAETFKGQATIASTFYWGSESDENPETGMSYGVDEYVDMNEDCYTAIRLGNPENFREGKAQLLGKLIKNCNGKIREIELDNFPAFIEK
jgi:hypothetical protein